MLEPIQPARRAVAAKGFALFDYFPDEEMLWDHKEVVYAEFFPAVIQ